MKKQWKTIRGTMAKMLVAALLVTVLPVTAHAKMAPLPEVYRYEVTADSPEWSKLETVDDKVEACRISEGELKDMQDAELIQAVLDFPLLIEVFAYDDPVIGVKSLEQISDAYRELISRKSAKASSLEVVRQRSAAQTSTISAEEEIKNDALISMILYQECFRNKLSVDELNEVADLSASIKVSLSPLSSYSTQAKTYVYTPKGTAVEYVTRTCSHSSSDYHATLDQQCVKDYGVTLVASGSCKYNCHSYAWHSQSANNKWINNPSAYMTDGSYKKVTSGINSSSVNVVSGDKVFYGSVSNLSSSHSAVVTSSATGSPLGTRKVKSKWGSLGVFSHIVSNVPASYDTSNVSAWHR